MNGTERFKIVMDILDKNDLVNNTRNHEIFDKLKDEDLSNEAKVAAVIETINGVNERFENNPNRYQENIMQKLRQRRGLEPYDTSIDSDLNTYTPGEVLDDVCNWEGLINYGSAIKNWIKDIYGIDIE